MTKPFLRLTHLVFVASLAFALWGGSQAAAQLRIATYNTGNAQDDQTLARPGMDTVLQAIGDETVNGIAKPLDVLVLQEQWDVAVTTQSFADVLNGIYGGDAYERGLVNGSTFGGGRMGIVYNSDTVQLVDELAFGNLSGNGQLRQTLRYQLRPTGYDSSADFYVYVDHYKAGSSGSDQSQRLVEGQSVRANADALGEGTPIIYAGDFNTRSSSESMYQTLLGGGNGQAFDPINAPGVWHNSSSMRFTHTQSPANTSHYPGQVLGGIDDRFDFQLVSGELLDGEGLNYIAGSYRAFGNNGTHSCCNSSITSGNGASATVLNALEAVSDHIPVVADYQVPAVMDVQVESLPPLIARGANVALDVTVSNLANVVAALGADELDYTITTSGDLFGSAGGIDAALGGGNVHPILLDTSIEGARSGLISVTSSSQGAVNSLVSIPVSFTVGSGGGGPTFGVIARDDFDTQLNRTSFEQTPDTGSSPFGSPADGFGVFQVGVSPTIPFALVDDSFSVFPADAQGVVDGSADSPGFKGDRWFGIVDLENPDNLSGTGAVSWTFDIAGASGIEVAIDMAAMGDFETADVFDWSYAIDGAAPEPLFTSSVDENGAATYTLASGSQESRDDPLSMTSIDNQTVVLSNQFQTLVSALTGTGAELTITLAAATDGDGGSTPNHEAYAFDNLVVSGFTGGGLTADFDLDNDVDGADFAGLQSDDGVRIADWEAEFGARVSLSSTAVAAPEPASLSLLLLAGTSLLAGRKRTAPAI